MADHDAEAYALAEIELKKVGTPLLTAVREYVQAKSHHANIIEACREYASRFGGVSPKTPAEATAELLLRVKKDKLSSRHIETLRAHLNRFSEAFQMPLSSINSRLISAWLDELETPEGEEASGRTRNNYRASIIQLFSFARTQKFLPRDLQTEAERTPKAKASLGVVGILSPSNLEKLLRAAESAGNEEAVLWLVLGAFSGLRSAELVRLRWEDIDLAGGEIDARADITKTGQARFVPITDNLRLWLAPFSERKGQIFSGRRALDRTTTFAEEQGLEWPSNCLRHSFGTYQLGLGTAIHETAKWMGNSVRMIETHYRAKAKRVREEALAWFAIAPTPKK